MTPVSTKTISGVESYAFFNAENLSNGHLGNLSPGNMH